MDTEALVTAGKMQADCDDIRITDAAGKILPYWIETGGTNACNQTGTKIWVKIPSINAGTNATTIVGNSPFSGQIDDIRIYNYALTDGQVKQVMNEGSAVRFGN